MIEKVLFVFKEKGFFGLFIATINFFLTRLFGIRITKDKEKIKNLSNNKVFSNCNLEYCEEGFYYLNPMPSVDELNEYYSSLYWDSREEKIYGVNIRDLVHFAILEEYIPKYLSSGKVFLNFGAGHGGISNLCWLRGMDIINVEPSSLPNFYTERWKTVEDIDQIENYSVDLIYGSHSLEHVQNIEKFKEQVSRVIKPDGFMFWEVPNASCPGNGAQRRQVDIPHTYYFEKIFFEKWFSNYLICSGYEQSQRFDVIQEWKEFKDDKGSVIRALGQINKS